MKTFGFFLAFFSIIGIVIGSLMLISGDLKSIPVILISILGLVVGTEIILKT